MKIELHAHNGCDGFPLIETGTHTRGESENEWTVGKRGNAVAPGGVVKFQVAFEGKDARRKDRGTPVRARRLPDEG